MKNFEIDHIEVSDINLTVNYWIPGCNDLQQIIFRTRDFENWLMADRNTSANAYWDHWDSYVLDELGSVILYQDMKNYLWYRFDMLRKGLETTPQARVPKKPMSRVSKTTGAAGSESA